MKDALTKYAKVSRCVVRTKGLFLKASGCDSAAPLDVSYDDDGLIYCFTGPQQLTDKDLEVLLALIAIATAQNDSFQTSVQFGGLSPRHRARRQLTAKVGLSTSYSALSREMARSVGGDTWPLITQALAKLRSVRVSLRFSDSQGPHDVNAGRLIDSSTVDETKGLIELRLSPALGSGILGGKGEFIQIATHESRALKKDRSGAARLLHLRLHELYAGRSNPVPESRLMMMVHGQNVVEGSTHRMRISALRKAMDQLGQLPGWRTSRGGLTYAVLRPDTKQRKACTRESVLQPSV